LLSDDTAILLSNFFLKKEPIMNNSS
jgi:hypothetical protein